MPVLVEDLAVALAVANSAAGVATRTRSDHDYQVEIKDDHSPVTTADLNAETAARSIIGRDRPTDSFLGEESSKESEEIDGRVWIVDPIDATRNFVRGIPIWATLVALVVDGRPVVGVVNAPDLRRCWWAAEGLGSFVGESPTDRGRMISTRSSATVEDAYLSTTAFDTWRRCGLDDSFQQLTERSYCNRGFGDFYQHCLVAEGVLDAALEPIVAPWDVAALVPIVSEAGGMCTDLLGNALPGTSTTGIVSSTRELHPRILEVFRDRQHP